jgi:dihydrofolate synthase/folylpolyglutamate synthase
MSPLDDLLKGLGSRSLPGIALGLARVQRLLDLLGNPETRLPPVIHVAGTNGKGSLIAYLRAIFTQAGYRVHQYISPALVRFNERILLNGEEISDAQAAQYLQQVREAVAAQPVTEFEAITAASLLAFAAHPADVLLLETGMGGRLDATNIVPEKILAAITPVSIDHAEFLGNTISAIAAEKAGIMQPGVPCVIGPQTPEGLKTLVQAARAKGCALRCFGEQWRVEAAKDAFFFRDERGE